jgi:hypothetical protein
MKGAKQLTPGTPCFEIKKFTEQLRRQQLVNTEKCV